MSRYIDAEKVLSYIYRLLGWMPIGIMRMVETDVIDIVRCKECKHRQNPYAPKWCYEMSKETDAYDYCSYGERKESE